jgi:nitroreductase
MNYKHVYNIFYSYLMDFLRFWRNLHMHDPAHTQLSAKAHMYRISHALEKGMALPKPREGFGRIKLKELLDFSAKYCRHWGVDHDVSVAFFTMKELLKYHSDQGHEMKDLEAMIDQLIENFPTLVAFEKQIKVGNQLLTREEIVDIAPRDPDAFFTKRCSVRQFDESKEIDQTTLKRIAYLAQKTPSVCNRQVGRLYIFTDSAKRNEILKYQDGNKGFGDTAGAILIVTADLTCFYKLGERNQGYIDGGMYVMSIVYIAHSLGLGSCMLNWSMDSKRDIPLRKIMNMPDNEVIVTMIALGHLKDQFYVAASPRRNLQDITKFNPTLSV